MSEKLYGHYDDLMDYETYPAHVMAMTKEGLHSKSEIAAELAYRDTVIADQQARIDVLEKEQAAWRKFTNEANQALEAADKKIASLLHENERLKIIDELREANRLLHGELAALLEAEK